MSGTISHEERARIAQNVIAVKEMLPEMVPFLQGLHAEGMIEGWRDVAYVGPHRPDPPGAVRVSEMALGSAAEVLAKSTESAGKARNRHGHG